jgi:uncharacterized protein
MVGSLNRQRVLNFLDTFSAGDIEGALARCSDDVEVFASAPTEILPHMGLRRGKAELRTTWQIIHTGYRDMRYEAPIVVAEADKVAVSLRVYITKRGNDRTIRFDMAAFYTLREGRITHIREIIDTFDLVQQVLERDAVAELTGKRSDGV